MTTDSIAAKAGLKVGDRLLSYDGKPLRSPATLQAWQQNTFEKLTVELRLRRGDETLTLNVPLGALGIEVRPDLSAAVLKLYEEGRTAQANPSRDSNGAGTLWTAAARAAQKAGDKAAAAWLYARVGAIHESLRQWQAARAAHAAAWELLKESKEPDAPAQSRTLSALGRCSQSLNDFPTASQWYEQALTVDTAAGLQMWAASDLNGLARIIHEQ